MKELIEKLESIKFLSNTDYVNNILTEAIQALSQSEWIKVEDRLPKDKEWYQVSNGKGVYTIPHTYRENEGWLDYDRFPTRARITHYRLLDLTPPQTK